MQRTTCAFSLFFQRREGRHLDDGGRGVRRGDDGRREVRLRDGGGRGVRCGDDGRREGRRRDCGGRGVRRDKDGRREGWRRDDGGRGVRRDKDGRREGRRRDDGGRRGDVAPVARVADEEAAAATNEEVKIGLWTSALRGCLFEIIGGVFCSWGLGIIHVEVVCAAGRTS